MGDSSAAGGNFVQFPEAAAVTGPVYVYDDFMSSSLDQFCSRVFEPFPW